MTVEMLPLFLARLLPMHTGALLPMHMGALHAYEKFLVLGLAFGPFVVLGIVVFFVRRRDVSEDEQSGG
jgi:hypothetical protein